MWRFGRYSERKKRKSPFLTPQRIASHGKNRKSSWSSTTPPTLDEKKLVYFSPQTIKLLTLINLHPNGLFWRDYFSALKGWCALKFLHTLEIDQGLLAHIRRGQGYSTPPPPKKNNSENLNNFRDSGSILTKRFHATCDYCERICWINFALGLAAPGGLTSVSAMHL